MSIPHAWTHVLSPHHDFDLDRALGVPATLLMESDAFAATGPEPQDAQAVAYRAQLPNGLTVVTAQRPDAETAAVTLGVRAGARFENEQTASSAQFLEQMYLQGTPSRPSRDAILRTVTARGGTMGVGTGWEFLDFTVVMAPEDFEVALVLLNDLLANSTFDPERLEHQRGLILQRLAERRDNPTARAFDIFYATVFKQHELRFLPSGTPEAVERLERDTLLHYRSSRVVPGNIVAGIVTPFDHDHVVTKVAATLGTLPATAVPSVEGAPPPQTSASKVENALGRDQAMIVIGAPTPGLNHPDRYPLWLLQTILGPGGGRLFYDIRDVHGLAYDTSMRLALTAGTGSLMAYAGTSPDNVERVLELLHGHLQRARDQLVSGAELEAAIGYLVGGTVVGLESGNAYASHLAHSVALGLPLTTSELEARLRGVTREDIRRVAQAYLAAEQLTTVIVAPGT